MTSPKSKPKAPRPSALKVFRYNQAGMYEFMCADTSGGRAAKRIGAPKTGVHRVELAEQDPDSDAVRLALKFPNTVWRRKSLTGGVYWDYWEYHDGDKPELPPVAVIITCGTTVISIPLDYLTVFGSRTGQLSDKERRARRLDDMVWDKLKRSGTVRYALSVGE